MHRAVGALSSVPDEYGESVSPRERSFVGWMVPTVGTLVAFILVFTMCFWGGLRPSIHRVAVLAALGLVALMLCCGERGRVRSMLGDPVLWAGLLFVGYLVLQWANAGRVLYFDVGFSRWQYAPPRWSGWPSAMDSSEALQMIEWFFPCWAVVVAARSPWMNGGMAMRILHVLACASGALSLSGIVLFASGTHRIYGIAPMTCHFFASFAYSNHAATFFLMMGALSAGLLWRRFWRTGGVDGSCRSGALIAIVLLNAMGACFSLSRTGVLLTPVVAAFALATGWRVARKRFTAAGRFRFALGAILLIVLASAAIFVMGESSIRHEFVRSDGGAGRTGWDMGLGHRFAFVRAALDMWVDHPWWGVGGWGFRHLVAGYVTPDLWPVLQQEGWANVHCDIVQFLTEFGVAGCSLLFVVIAGLVASIGMPRRSFDPLRSMGLLAVAIPALHGLIDIPLRCPAVLYAGAFILAVLPKLAPPSDAEMVHS